MQLTGIHHLTAVTARPSENLRFYTDTLGLRLVKKTVNQDDTSAYHLFYGDGAASPGSDLTFFDWPLAPERRGTHSIIRTALRVDGREALDWWRERFDARDVNHDEITKRDARWTLDFEDPEGQRLSLIDDSGDANRSEKTHPWNRSSVPAQNQIRGLGPITLSVPDLAPTDQILTVVLTMRRVREYAIPLLKNGAASSSAVHVYEMGAGENSAAEMHVAVEPSLPPAQLGAGAVHHVAFRTPDFSEYEKWIERLRELRIPNSGPVNRFYFRSLYFREPNGILFEIATDGPGFAVDEPLENLGERLSLPPFLESRRSEIEAALKPLV